MCVVGDAWMAKPSTDTAPNAESTVSIGPEIFNPVLTPAKSSKQKESAVTTLPACSRPLTMTRALDPGRAVHDASAAELKVTGYPSTSIPALVGVEVTTPSSAAVASPGPGKVSDRRSIEVAMSVAALSVRVPLTRTRLPAATGADLSNLLRTAWSPP